MGWQSWYDRTDTDQERYWDAKRKGELQEQRAYDERLAGEGRAREEKRLNTPLADPLQGYWNRKFDGQEYEDGVRNGMNPTAVAFMAQYHQRTGQPHPDWMPHGQTGQMDIGGMAGGQREADRPSEGYAGPVSSPYSQEQGPPLDLSRPIGQQEQRTPYVWKQRDLEALSRAHEPKRQRTVEEEIRIRQANNGAIAERQLTTESGKNERREADEQMKRDLAGLHESGAFERISSGNATNLDVARINAFTRVYGSAINAFADITASGMQKADPRAKQAQGELGTTAGGALEYVKDIDKKLAGSAQPEAGASATTKTADKLKNDGGEVKSKLVKVKTKDGKSLYLTPDQAAYVVNKLKGQYLPPEEE